MALINIENYKSDIEMQVKEVINLIIIMIFFRQNNYVKKTNSVEIRIFP